MRHRGLRAAGSLLAVPAVVFGLAACGGSSTPTVASSGFISKCTGNQQITQAVKQIGGGSAKVEQLCKCVQKRLVDGGFGNRTTSDQGTDIRNAGRDAGVACAQQVLAGG